MQGHPKNGPKSPLRKKTKNPNSYRLPLFHKLFKTLIPKMGRDELFPFLEMNILLFFEKKVPCIQIF